MAELTEKDITNKEELISLIKEGNFFLFCVLCAINLGFKDAVKNKQQVAFSVGDYYVTFDPVSSTFTLSHQVYIARIIIAGYHESVFIGENFEEVAEDVLLEFNKINETK